MNLNPQQVEAVRHGEGPLLVIAGAGSGKTRVIVHRIAHLIEHHNVHPANLLAVTFTNKAAGEMRSRLEKMLGVRARDLWIATFHSTCLRMLRQHSVHVGYGPHFQIFDEADSISLIKECLKELNISDKLIQPGSALDQISRAKDRCNGPEDYRSSAGNFYQEKLAGVFDLYQKRLIEVQAMDFGDLIRLAVKLFEKNPSILTAYQKRFSHVMVDEYQDTNHAQYRLIEMLVRNHKNICVVGDEDQSIYRWRGADISNILRFEKDFEGAKVIRLEQNYRSTKTIIDAATKLISNNAARKPKTLWTENRQGQSINIISSVSEREEAEAIADRISEMKKEGRSYNDIAIFYRTNAQSRPFEDVFMEAGIRHRIFGGFRFYERREIKDAIAYLRLIAEPKDDVSFARIINVPARGIGKETLLSLREFASSKGIPLFEAINDFVRICHSEPRAGRGAKNPTKKLLAFREMIEGLREDALKRPLSELLQDVLEKSGYVADLSLKKTTEAAERLENINELVAAVDEFDPDPDSPALVQFLDQVALISDLDKMNEGEDAVTLMTLHLAKGLEFPVVFVGGMEEGLFPHVRSLEDPDELEEERRLCYVGMTRAKEILTMSHAFRRRVFGTTRYGVPSRFLDEIPKEHVNTVIARSVSDEAIPRKPWDRHVALRAPRDDAAHDDFDQRPPEEIVPYRAGMRVIHPTFGGGFIKKCEPSSSGHKVTVQFKNGALKRFIAERAGLTFIQN